MAFDPNWPHGHQTRDGRKARIICTDAKSGTPIIALVDNGNGREFMMSAYSDGSAGGSSHECYCDLINAPEKVERWGVLYIERDSAYRSSLDEAKAIASPIRSGFVKFTFINGKPVSAEIVEA